MNVLVDSSLWIEFFQKKPRIDLTSLELLLEERRVVTCLPIQAEILSGKMDHLTAQKVKAAFEVMIHVDPDWNSPIIWKEIATLAHLTKKKGQKMPGLVDRMILIAAKTSGSLLWSMDKHMNQLAVLAEVQLFLS
ncbi:MAG: hypothetical protein A3I05_03500 [Deltaproteobacteria bacterium RIFCSPLOWO2_02_FULL_44_10]|nr:MAG: hypothetical protein A3C46_03075 [Deltaproteobacteria bacterium RIFCSPHIGHO2_02_FULL_44_16]OGQ46238.1 MAG: hypothetical protein A3I05_03500 [Deltaproteobacteria bacterium RIFCSPLOWO2_02_FULL_44_10]